MTRSRLAVWAYLAVVAALIACGTGVKGDDDRAMPLADASTDTSSVATDGGSPDGAPPSQGGRPCPDAAFFCDDFDVDELGARWSFVQQYGAQLLILPEAGLSPPNGLRVVTKASATGSGRDGRLRKTIEGPFTTLKCSFAIKVLALNADTDFVMFRMDNGNPTLWLDLNDNQTLLQGVAESGIKLAGLPIDKWVRVSATVEPSTLTITYDGDPDAGYRGPINHVGTFQNAEMLLGLLNYELKPAIADYDDVVCERF